MRFAPFRRATSRRASSASPPVLVSLAPDLGCIYGGATLCLAITGTANAATIGGTACTGVEQVGPVLYVVAPAKDAGTYDVQVSGPGGASNVLTAAYEAWHPTTSIAAARVYQSDRGITSAGSATRYRAGTWGADRRVGGASQSTDGQGILELASGRLILAGGAPGGNHFLAVNTIWSSDDRGKTWAVLLADGAPSSTRPHRGHTFPFFLMTIAGTDYVYWIGGEWDALNGDVFRIPASALDVGGDPNTPWERVSTTAPTATYGVMAFGVLDGVIYMFGGWTGITDSDTASNLGFKSLDYGATWTAMGAQPWTSRGGQLQAMPEKDGKLWLVSGANYHTTTHVFRDDVWSFDGATWTEELATGHGQFLPRRYHSVLIDVDGVFWMINGSTLDGVTLAGDTSNIHTSPDGATWTALGGQQAAEWAMHLSHAQAAVSTSAGVIVADGYASDKVFAFERCSGALASAWADQGSGAKHLAQATDAAKPIVVPGAMGEQPGLAFTGAQVMTLAAPDRGIAGGHYEAWFVGRTSATETVMNTGCSPPNTIIGAVNASGYNEFGFYQGELDYVLWAPGYTPRRRGVGNNDDVARLYGATHALHDLRFYVGSVQQGATVTTDDFDTTYTGFDSVGAGYQTNDFASAMLGAVVVLREASGVAFRAKLALWALKWMGRQAAAAASAPLVEAISPGSGLEAGGTAITNLSGAFFRSGATVTIGGAPATDVVRVSADQITCTTPAGTVGPADVVVTNPDAQDSGASGAGLFTYAAAEFDPTSITGLTFDLDPRDATESGGSMTVLPGATITAGEEPAYTAANASYGSLPTWDVVATADAVRLSAGQHGFTTGPYTIVFVGDVGSGSKFCLGSLSGLYAYGGAGAGAEIGISGNSLGTILAGGGPASTPSVFVFVFNGASSKVYRSAKTPSTGSSGTTPDLSAAELVLSNYSIPAIANAQTGGTARVLGYTGALSQGDCEAILDGLGALYGISIGA